MPHAESTGSKANPKYRGQQESFTGKAASYPCESIKALQYNVAAQPLATTLVLVMFGLFDAESQLSFASLPGNASFQRWTQSHHRRRAGA
jgi:hypothetical protein